MPTGISSSCRTEHILADGGGSLNRRRLVFTASADALRSAQARQSAAMTHTATEHYSTGCSESVSANGQLIVGPFHSRNREFLSTLARLM